MNIKRLDLNLLVVFDAVARTGSITAAARSLALSQPAVSHALNRLRAICSDPLFVRDGHRIVPTPRAQAMQSEVTELISRAYSVLQTSQFDPSQTRHVYRVGVSDYAALCCAPALLKGVRRSAPHAAIEFTAIETGILDQMANGQLHCSFWGAALPQGPYEAVHLFEDSFVAVMHGGPSKSAPKSKGLISLDAYASRPHVRVATPGATASPVDVALEKLGKSRRIVATTPGFNSIFPLIQGTDIIASVPRRLGAAAQRAGLRVFPLPFAVSPFPYYLIWHRRLSEDPAQRWFREQVKASSSLRQAAIGKT